MSSFLEEIGKKLSQASQDALEKTKRYAEISKINVKLLEEEEQLEKLYANLGRLYFQLNEKEPEIIYQDLFRAIEGSLQNIAHCQKTINEMKGLKACQSCGEEIAEGAVYCPQCGKILNNEVKELIYRICINCGTVSIGEEECCLNCENPL